MIKIWSLKQKENWDKLPKTKTEQPIPQSWVTEVLSERKSVTYVCAIKFYPQVVKFSSCWQFLISAINYHIHIHWFDMYRKMKSGSTKLAACWLIIFSFQRITSTAWCPKEPYIHSSINPDHAQEILRFQ